MNNFHEWFSNKVTVAKLPSNDDIQAGLLDHFEYRINVSDLYRPEIDAAFKRFGVESFGSHRVRRSACL